MAGWATVARADDGAVVCRRCLVADTLWLRLRGLLGRRSLPEEEGILLRPAGAIHTLFMGFAIDAVFLDRELRVLKVAADLRPWRLAARPGARAVLELAAGRAARVGLRPGDRLELAPGRARR